jgi:hypothetical protein
MKLQLALARSYGHLHEVQKGNVPLNVIAVAELALAQPIASGRLCPSETLIESVAYYLNPA